MEMYLESDYRLILAEMRLWCPCNGSRSVDMVSRYPEVTITESLEKNMTHNQTCV